MDAFIHKRLALKRQEKKIRQSESWDGKIARLLYGENALDEFLGIIIAAFKQITLGRLEDETQFILGAQTGETTSRASIADKSKEEGAPVCLKRAAWYTSELCRQDRD